MNNVITKEQFAEAINAMMNIYDYQEEKNKLYKKFNVDGYLLEPTNNDIIIKLIMLLLPDSCDKDSLTAFCFDNNYGRGKSNQYYINSNGLKLKIQSPDDLYDYLTGNNEE